MKVSSRNIKSIKSRIEWLKNECSIEAADVPCIGDDTIYLEFPYDDFEDGICIKDFIDYTSDLEHLVRENDSTVRMGNIRQTILNIDDYRYYYLTPSVEYNDDILELRIVEKPLLVGIIASKEGIFNDFFGVRPMTGYKAVELRYKGFKRLTPGGEDEIIAQYLYFIVSKYDCSIEIGTFDYWDDLTGEDKPEDYELSNEDLVPYSDAMEYYTQALRINDFEIQFHHLYKIIEHFSPIVAKKLAYERLNQKLDSLAVVKRDYQYLDSLLELSKHYEFSKSDSILCKTVLQECVDIVPIYKLLPGSVRKEISKRCSFKILSINDCSTKEITQIKDELSKIIYSTRNRIVHAKSNWEPSDYACEGEDMEKMNAFMKALAQCLIIWNGRQPKEFRI